jgi:hypothetical protein
MKYWIDHKKGSSFSTRGILGIFPFAKKDLSHSMEALGVTLAWEPDS